MRAVLAIGRAAAQQHAVLEDGEHDVGDLAGRLAVSATNVSQHLALLRRQGLVQPRRVGTRVCYSLRDRRIADLIGTALEVIDVDADQARDTRRAIRRLRGRR